MAMFFDVDYVIYFVKCHGLFDNPASLKNGPSKGGYWVCCDCLASMVVFDNSGCTVLYLFKMFNLSSGVWIPYRRRIFKFWSD